MSGTTTSPPPKSLLSQTRVFSIKFYNIWHQNTLKSVKINVKNEINQLQLTFFMGDPSCHILSSTWRRAICPTLPAFWTIKTPFLKFLPLCLVNYQGSSCTWLEEFCAYLLIMVGGECLALASSHL